MTAEEFAAVAEPGAEPLLGEAGQAVIPQEGDAVLYGDGGASKTTLVVDLGFHLAAGDAWLDIPVPKPLDVLVIEAEGPRPLFRDKIRRKLEAWPGSDLGGRLHVLERPWATFRFPEAGEIADLVGRLGVDVLIVGPLTRVGMDELGTLQQVRDFMAAVARFRARSGRSLTVVLVHHSNKAGSVSGAWEGAGDLLLHATVRGPGRTTLEFQKVRWSSKWHKRTLELDWTPGEGFEVAQDGDRDILADVTTWLAQNPHKTTKEIATGIAARESDVKDALNRRKGDGFQLREGEQAKEVGRHKTAKVWEVSTDAE